MSLPVARPPIKSEFCRQVCLLVIVWAASNAFSNKRFDPLRFSPCDWPLDIDAFTCAKYHAHKSGREWTLNLVVLG